MFKNQVWTHATRHSGALKFALKLRDFANAREPWNLVLEHWFSLVGERQGALIVGT